MSSGDLMLLLRINVQIWSELGFRKNQHRQIVLFIRWIKNMWVERMIWTTNDRDKMWWKIQQFVVATVWLYANRCVLYQTFFSSEILHAQRWMLECGRWMNFNRCRRQLPSNFCHFGSFSPCNFNRLFTHFSGWHYTIRMNHFESAKPAKLASNFNGTNIFLRW